MREYRCYLTQDILIPGDIVILPINGIFRRAIIVKFTSSGVWISRKLEMSTRGWAYPVHTAELDEHNSKYYTQWNQFIKIGHFEGDLNQFKLTLKQFEAKYKEENGG